MQAIVGIFAIGTRDSIAGTLMLSFATTWLVDALVLYLAVLAVAVPWFLIAGIAGITGSQVLSKTGAALGFLLAAVAIGASSWPGHRGRARSGTIGRMGLTTLPAAARDRLASAPLTYPEAGATAGQLPAGYHHLTRRVVIGHGARRFAEAGAAVLGWQVQVRAGLRIAVSVPAAAPGAVLIIGLGAGPARFRAPCRVVYAVDETRRRGFAYGTLPGHPESGEEAFIVEHHDDDSVTFTITAFSRPATRLATLAGPLGRVVQARVTARYLRTLAAA